MLRFKPANKVAAKMSAEELSVSPAVLDVELERKSDGVTRLLINVVFHSVPLRRPLMRGYWYVACQAAHTELQSSRGDIVDTTPAAALEFSYNNSSSTETERSFELKPKAEAEVGPARIKSEGPGAKSSKKRTKSEGFEYTGQENQLSVAATSRNVSWQMSMVRGQHAISDYLFGTLPLWVDCDSKKRSVKGSIRLLPSIFSFDEDKRRMSDLQSFLMQLALAFRSTKVMNQDETKVSFEDVL